MLKALLILGLLVVVQGDPLARYLTRDDFTYVTKQHQQKIRINKDGKREVHTKLQYHITKEEGRKQLGTYQIAYNSGSTKLQVVNASVTNGKKVSKVASHNIVDSPVVVSAHGFDAQNIVKIALPKLKLGSIIDIEYKEVEQNAALKDHFSKLMPFGVGSYEERRSIEIISDNKIYHQFNDPWKVLYVSSKTNEKGQYVISAKLKRPFGKLDALRALFSDPKYLTFLLVSTDKGLEGIVKKFAPAYENVINGPLPPTLEKIVKGTKEKAKLVDKVNYAISQIIQEYNYLGDWRTVQGQLIPKGFDKLEKTKYGDCKDFSSALTAILRKVGVKAWVAWTTRASVAFKKDYDTDLVFLGGFNHAIVYIQDAKGKEFWVDPTHQYANGLAINDDLASSMALVLNPEIKEAKTLPPINYKDHRVEIEQTYDFKDLNKASVEGRTRLAGRFSAEFIGAERKMSKPKIEEKVISMVSLGEKKTFPIVSGINLKDIVNRELDFLFKYTAEKTTRREKGNNFIMLPHNIGAYRLLNASTNDGMSDALVGMPYILKRKIAFKGVHFIGKRLLNCSIDSKWISLKRSIVEEGQDYIVYNEEMELKEPFISLAEFKNSNHSMLLEHLSNCYRQNSIQISLGARQGQSSSQKLAELFKELPLEERITKRSNIAVTVLKRMGRVKKSEYRLDDAHYLMMLNTQEDPSHEESYVYLSRITMMLGYYAGSQYSATSLSEAAQVIDVGIKHLGRTPKLLLKRAEINHSIKKDKAEVTKIIEEVLNKKDLNRDLSFLRLLSTNYQRVDGPDKYLAVMKEFKSKAETKEELLEYDRELAEFYSSYGNWKKCTEYYESYFKEMTDDYWSYNNVGICYRSQQQFDKAIATYKKALSLVHFGAATNGLVLSYIGKGNALIYEKKFAEAKLTFHNALAISAHKDAYYSLAVINFLEEDVDAGMANIGKVLEQTKGVRANILGHIFHLIEKLGNNKISNLSEKLLKSVTTTEEKLFIAVTIIKSLYDRKIYYEKKVNEMYDLVRGLELENRDLIEHNDYVKLNLASSYFMIGIMKNDILLFEKSMVLVDKVKNPKPYAKEIAMLRQSINIFESKTGRKPASLLWKGKKKAHIFLKEKFNYDLIDLGFPRNSK